MEAYDKLRNEVLLKLMQSGNRQTAEALISALDSVATNYTVLIKENTVDNSQDILAAYLNCKEFERLASGTLENYSLLLRNFLSKLTTDLTKVSTNDLRMCLRDYQHERGISDQTLNKYRDYLCSFFTWAHNEGYLDRNPAVELKKVRCEKKQKEFLTQTELEYIRQSCRNIRERAIIEVLYSTGCRASELVSLKKADIDWDAKTVHLFGKGRKHRTSFINAKAEVYLKQYLSGRVDSSDYLFVSLRAPYNPIKVDALEKVIRELSDIVEPIIHKRFTPHMFRHTTATTAIRNGMPVEDIQKLLGHENIATTMVYAKSSLESVQANHRKHVV